MPILISQLQSVVRNRRSRVPNLQRVDLEGAFRIPAPDEFGNIETFSSSLFGTSVKRQVRDIVEPLDRDCIAAGIELHGLWLWLCRVGDGRSLLFNLLPLSSG